MTPTATNTPAYKRASARVAEAVESGRSCLDLLTDAEYDWACDIYGYVDGDVAARIVADRESAKPRQTSREAKQYLEHGVAIKAARKAAKAAGWPALAGTTKQKYWALQLREQLVATMDPAMAAFALRHTSAAWWIGHRDTPIGALNAELAEQKAKLDEANRQEAERAAARVAAILAADAAKQPERDAKAKALRDALPQFLPLAEAHQAEAKPVAKSFAPLGLKIADGNNVQVGSTAYAQVRVFQHGTTGELTILFDARVGDGPLDTAKLAVTGIQP